MRARPSGRTRRVSGWALFIATVLGLRLAGFGADQSEVGASADPSATTIDSPADIAARAFAGIAAGFDLSAFEAATDRCLAAGLECTVDDVLHLDTTQLRLAGLATRLTAATDPADAGYLGRPDGPTATRVAEARAAARGAADALGAFLASGCAGSIEGVAVERAPEGCDATTARARAALDDFERTAAELAAGAP